ncbi:methyltransferase domain-containing protein [Colletotrichum karsti]|uniref:Methyltransferase domain-containing protein n=1 Tax=Colletotrichum karsti TaxID=1095194 RepID=A0A9P6LJI2_9PEZI|nr:methyltransferase domain-containing protein [Colletotrichum karsti]KAF9878399.1 methyltransferase domain-containing protein [Colletotrichum karsti]
MAASLRDWPTFVGRVYHALTPNGWAEFSDMSVLYGCDDGTLTEDHALMKWDRLFIEACDTLGREHSPGPKLEGWVRQARFKNIRHHHFKIPLGPWAKNPHMKDLGWHNLAQTMEGLDAFTLKLFISVLGWKREEVINLLEHVRDELMSNTFHAYLNYHVVYGQKVLEI